MLRALLPVSAEGAGGRWMKMKSFSPSCRLTLSSVLQLKWNMPTSFCIKGEEGNLALQREHPQKAGAPHLLRMRTSSEHRFLMMVNDLNNCNECPLSGCSVPGIVLRISYLLAHLIHKITPSGEKPGCREPNLITRSPISDSKVCLPSCPLSSFSQSL